MKRKAISSASLLPIVLSTISTTLLLLIPNSAVFGQSPWGLFQTLCPAGQLASGPQCQNLLTGNNIGIGMCNNAYLISIGVCVPTTTSTCPIGSVLQNGVCVPFINPIQSPPIANAGQDQTVTEGFLVSLDGASSYATTSGATIVSYAWTQTPTATVGLNGATTSSPFFRAPAQATTLTFSLRVTDSLGQVSSPDSVTITGVPQ
ncbi:MAG: hypothetical protein WCF23_16445 [Candidatus Nitrosopolaris sp.]